MKHHILATAAVSRIEHWDGLLSSSLYNGREWTGGGKWCPVRRIVQKNFARAAHTNLVSAKNWFVFRETRWMTSFRPIQRTVPLK